MSDAKDFVIEKGVLKKYNGNDGVVVIPEGVTSIGEEAFYGCNGLTSVTIQEGVTSIGARAFYGCSSLTSVTIPESVTSIGNWAFRGCSGLTSVTIPKGMTSIGWNPFGDCSSLKKVVYTGSLESWMETNKSNWKESPLSNGAVLYCNDEPIRDLIIPSGVTSIGEKAFWGCSGLTNVTIPEGVTSIGNSAFEDCSGLTSVTIPEGVTSIGNLAFYGCSGLTSVTIPDSVTSIGGNAFRDCSGLTSVTIPSSVTSIGNLAFCGCSGLASVTIPASVTSIGECAFYGCSGLTSVTISEGVTSIGSSAFSDCSSLTSMTIPASVMSIGESAFRGCSGLTSVTIPAGVTSIGKSAFFGCSNLTSMTIPNSVTSIGEDAFKGCSSLTGIHIPNLSLLPKELQLLACITSVTAKNADPASEAVQAGVAFIKRRRGKPEFIDIALKNPALISFMCREKLITAAGYDQYWQAAEENGDPAVKAVLLDYRQNGLGAKKLDAARGARQKKQEKDEDLIIMKAVRRASAEGIKGLVFAITGGLRTFENRDAAKQEIERLGGKLASGVTANVDYLITNDTDSGSEKNKRAAGLGIEVIDEKAFNRLIGRPNLRVHW